MKKLKNLRQDFGALEVGTDEIVNNYKKATPGEDRVDPASPDESSMAMDQAKFIGYVADDVIKYLEGNNDFPEWMQNKLSALHEKAKGLHANMAGKMNEAVEELEEKAGKYSRRGDKELYQWGDINQAMMDSGLNVRQIMKVMTALSHAKIGYNESTELEEKYRPATKAEIEADKKKDRKASGKKRPSASAKSVNKKQYGNMMGRLKEKEFKPHMMYDPKTGKAYKAEKPEDHERMSKMGYTHEKPKKEEVTEISRSMTPMKSKFSGRAVDGKKFDAYKKYMKKTGLDEPSVRMMADNPDDRETKRFMKDPKYAKALALYKASFKEEVDERKLTPKEIKKALASAKAKAKPKSQVSLKKAPFKIPKEELEEVLKVSDGMGQWIKDFQASDAPQFKGKDDDERKEMAIAAYLAAKKREKGTEK